ncbi:MAG: class I SAM-dependent methyltransferase [bacterium]|nr:class I SAM-dependent methyltransferase [bacterium]
MYDSLAKGYDELYGEEQEKKLQKIAPFLKGRILDIGAGTGIVAKHFPNVVSLDPSLEMLKHASGMKVLGEAEHLPFKAGSFDTIVSLTALHHTNIPKVIKELKRMKAPLMVLSILTKSKKCTLIISSLRKTFEKIKIIEEEKDMILIIK